MCLGHYNEGKVIYEIFRYLAEARLYGGIGQSLKLSYLLGVLLFCWVMSYVMNLS